MKLEFQEEKIIIYLTYEKLNIDNIEKLNKDIKKLFIKLIKKYELDLYGYSKVTIYNNEYYGNVLEIEKIYNSDFNKNIIDLKVLLYKNVPMDLEFDDYNFDKKIDNIIIKNGKYYLNIDKTINIIKYIEYGKVNYSNNS